jgi:DNA-binding NarL/FixJ family response regulator
MGTPCRALIVDDEDDMAFLIRTTLQLASDRLVVAGVASSGQEAIERLPTARADVVVLDHRMPDRNGLEIAAEVLGSNPEVNIVLFTAHLDDATLAEAERVGIRECVTKDRIRDLPDILHKYCPSS